MDPLITMQKVGRRYRMGEEEVVALSSVDLDIAVGELVAMVGTSGSG